MLRPTRHPAQAGTSDWVLACAMRLDRTVHRIRQDDTPPACSLTSRSSGRSSRQRSTAMRAARMEGAAGRQVAQQRRQAGNALHHPLALQRRQAGDQHLRVGMLRRGDDLRDRRDLHQAAGIHHAEPVDELRHQSHVVADQNDRRAKFLLHAGKRHHHLALHHDIERAGRFVGDDHLGAQADGDGDAGALLHAAGQLVRIHLRHLGRQADQAEQIAHARRRGRAATGPCHDRPARRRSARECAAPG